MKANLKLFLAMASFVAAMCIVFGLLTMFIVKAASEAAVQSTRGDQLEALAEPLIRYYEDHGRSWEGVGQLRLEESVETKGREISLLLVSPQNQVLLKQGEEGDDRVVRRLGIRKPLLSNGSTVAVLYEYDPDVAMLSKLRYGIPISVLTLLVPSAAAFIVLSLLVAWGLSKRMTSPLRRLMPAIERLGRGDYGVQAPVAVNDEYGQVARAFNEMSLLLRDAEENRRSLVADVAHELRTPITIIRGKLDLLQHGGERIAPENLLPLQDELIRLTRLIDDLHQLSLAEARKLPIERRPTNLCELLRRIVERVGPDAERKGIRMELACEAGFPVISVDPNRMTQVFLNLAVNAVRYTQPNGAVNLTVREEAGGLRVEVADNGPGIEPRHLPHIFDRFYRADEARARHGGGAGLGLAIAKGYVTAHDGTIEAASSPGQGTTFTVRLPGPAERAAPEPPN
ncbi:sensor histidine kinase [Cohnella zeiphila]|uniref:histidine kinase n=1 Tax=Cohnella zeiphila TaxID=2761120 RepID=A0A7X0STK1_9BACL|nr:ATP-binding protein [Cohnella zeiphila]MBB6735731.1 HAMP domain-containing protein [Cohnella zeiphila]